MAQFIDESHARKVVERWRASGLGVVEFTKREGISVGKFYRMRAIVDAAADPHIVPVVVRSASAPAKAAPSSVFVVELASGKRIRVAAGFDATELMRLVEAPVPAEDGAAAVEMEASELMFVLVGIDLVLDKERPQGATFGPMSATAASSPIISRRTGNMSTRPGLPGAAGVFTDARGFALLPPPGPRR